VTPRQIAALPLTAALGLAALAGCSSSPATSPAAAGGSATGSASAAPASSAAAGNAGLGDSALRSAFSTAANGATAVHMKGSLTQNGETLGLDLQLNKNDSSQGTITIGTAQLPIKVVGGVSYLQMTPSFVELSTKQEGMSASDLAMLNNKWVSSNTSIGKSLSDGFSQFMTFSAVIKSVSDNSDGDTATAAGTTTLDGRTVALYDTTQGSKLYFAATGPAYMLREDDSGADGTGTINFTWNQPATVSAPPSSQIYTG
jgi:hypothetical protein